MMSKLYTKAIKKIIFPLADLIMHTKLMHYYNQIKRILKRATFLEFIIVSAIIFIHYSG